MDSNEIETTRGTVEMLAPMCDWDDINYVNMVLNIINRSLIFDAISEVNRYKSLSNNQPYIGYTHTIKYNKK